MKLKQRVGDFRVRELLREDFLRKGGAHRVYRLTKRKLTTPEAVRAVADLAGVESRDVAIAGLKDRQGITIQYVSVPRGPEVRIQDKELRVETAGFSAEPISSAASRGNAFEIGVRALGQADVQRLRENLPLMRNFGVVNYFDDQRFGNLEFGQGWILMDLFRGDAEKALRALLTGSSERDDEHHKRFKGALDRAWGDWRGCREIAGKFGAHHSIFELLGREPENFVRAFDHVATRIKTIHLFAYQSHLWNRAVADLVRGETSPEERVAMAGIEGPLISWADKRPAGLANIGNFPLPGPGLDDVKDARAYSALEDVLAKQRLVPDQLRLEGMGGFHLKGELRPLVVIPEHLRVRPPEFDNLNPGYRMLRIRFELPRGSYATLVVKRLLTPRVGEETVVEDQRERHGSGSDGNDGWGPDRNAGSGRGNQRGFGQDRGREGRFGSGDNRRGDSRGRDGGRGQGEPWGNRDRESQGDRRPSRNRTDAGGAPEGNVWEEARPRRRRR